MLREAGFSLSALETPADELANHSDANEESDSQDSLDDPELISQIVASLEKIEEEHTPLKPAPKNRRGSTAPQKQSKSNGAHRSKRVPAHASLKDKPKSQSLASNFSNNPAVQSTQVGNPFQH